MKRSEKEDMIKNLLRKSVRILFRLFNFELFSRAQTTAFLNAFKVVSYEAHPVNLPEVSDLINKHKIYFKAVQSTTENSTVWVYKSEQKKASLLPYGSVLTRGKVLCTDFNHRGVLQGLLTFNTRTPVATSVLIAPWTQYLDGIMFGGYYDFIINVFAKLCRMKNALSEQAFREALVAYPLFNTTYEREYLDLLGISPNRVYDSRLCKITFDTCVLGNSGHWFYPNIADILSMKKIVESTFLIRSTHQKRIYVSRAGRRRVLNENEVIALVKRYGFEVIEDVPRSVAEQYEIYRNAAFIIGPHGASFTNIIWCQPGTHLFELFSASYVPDHFHYLAQILKLRYSAYCYGSVRPGDLSKGVEEDIFVSIPEFEQCLNAIFKNQAGSATNF
ncbi:MAG: glycosyltransferase family 61 protein [Cytophagaceae bacterium]|nr:glycosyltransferase family 61 protein [Cytophagaceae bacterium]